MSSLKEKLKSNKILWVILSVIVALALIWGLVFALIVKGGDKDTKVGTSKPTATATVTVTADPSSTTTLGVVGWTGTEQAGKKSALAFGKKFLQANYDEIKGMKDVETTLTDLNQGKNNPTITKDLDAYYDWSGVFKDQTYKNMAYFSSLLLGNIVGAAYDKAGEKEIQYYNSTAANAVSFDAARGEADVPLIAFLGPNGSYSLHLVWNGHVWKVKPYGIVDSIQAVQNYSANSEEASANPSALPSLGAGN